jgi:hypothetical protein
VTWLPFGVRDVVAGELVSAAELADAQDQLRGTAYGRRPSRDLVIPAQRGSGNATQPSTGGYITLSIAAGSSWRVPLRLPVGSRVFEVWAWAQSPGSCAVQMELVDTAAAGVQLEATTATLTGSWAAYAVGIAAAVRSRYVTGALALHLHTATGPGAARVSAIVVRSDAIALM